MRYHDTSLKSGVRDGLGSNATANQGRPLTASEKAELARLRSSVVEKYLDSGFGTCLLKDPALAAIVQNALLHFHDERYHLHAWSVMPNHVHAVVQPNDEYDLSNITHSWKSYTSHTVNQLLHRTGALWHKESFDRILRNHDEYLRTIEYVINNPVAAGLENWKFVGTNPP